MWPIPFSIPKFSYDCELKLRKGNATNEKSNMGFDVTRDIKVEILDKISQAIIEIKSYPEKDEIESVAPTLVLKYPCLKEPGSITGYDGWETNIKYKLRKFRSKLREAGCNEVDGWKTSIKYKLGKFRSKLREAGCNEVDVNRKKKVGDDHEHHDDSNLEEERVALVDETKKKKKKTTLMAQDGADIFPKAERGSRGEAYGIRGPARGPFFSEP